MGVDAKEDERAVAAKEDPGEGALGRRMVLGVAVAATQKRNCLRYASVLRRDPALVLLLGAIWGVSFMFISMGLRHATPLWLAALRFYLAGALSILIALAWKGRGAFPRTGRDWGSVLAAGILFIAGYHGLLFWGQARTTAPISSVIVALNPILTLILSTVLLQHERLPRQGVAGLVLGFVGVALLAVLRGGDPLDARGIGELVILLAVLCWSLSSILTKRIGATVHPLALSGWQMLIGAVVLHIAAWPLEAGGHVDWNAESVVALLYISLGASLGGFFLYYALLPRLGPIRINLVSYIVPAFATLASWLALGAPLEWRAIFAYALVAVGFALVARSAPIKAAPPVPPE